MERDLAYRWSWLSVNVRWWLYDGQVLVRQTIREFLGDQCPQLAASISYYILFSIFPLALLFITVAGLVLANDSVRADLVNSVLDALPLSEAEGREDVEGAIDSLTAAVSIVGVISVLGLVWSGSSVMGALRRALNQVWDTDYKRPFLRGKLLDIGMMATLGVLFGASLGVTIFLQIARRVSEATSDILGPFSSGTSLGVEFAALAVPLLLSFVTFMMVYRVVPGVRTQFSSVWPGALLAAVLFEILKNGFAVYLRYFGNYDAVYGSLGTVIAFLFFVYLNANILLLGAEMAAEWPRVTHGYYDRDPDSPSRPRAGSLLSRTRAALATLVTKEEKAPEHIQDHSPKVARLQRRADEIARRIGRSRSPGN
ncbi:MAG TPA: YihY/virulence factor BrkB family protein [Dehalococcoidia bacterium]|nr:YihY/virulence factor BrkB family protein [Dehalococcoidia bacterium]